MSESTLNLVELAAAIVIAEDQFTRVGSPGFIGMTVVYVAFTDRDLCEVALYLNQFLGSEVIVKDVSVCVDSPDVIGLEQRASPDSDLCESDLARQLGEFLAGGIVTIDFLRSIKAPDLGSTGGNLGERTRNLREFLCGCGGDDASPAND